MDQGKSVSGLDQLKAAQQRIFSLQDQGVEMRSPEARRAANRLMTLIRHADPQDLAAFDAWAAQERQRRSEEKQSGKGANAESEQER